MRLERVRAEEAALQSGDVRAELGLAPAELLVELGEPLLAAGVAVVIVGSAPPAGQLAALAFFAGLLGAAFGTSALRRAR